MRCEFHGFEDCGICDHPPNDKLRDLVPVRTLYPGRPTERDLGAIEREFPNALTVLDWMAPSWYRAHPEARLIRTDAGRDRPEGLLVAVAGRQSIRWAPAAQVWIKSSRGVSSYYPSDRRNHRNPARRRDDHGEVLVAIQLEGPTQPGESPPFLVLPLLPTTISIDTETYNTEAMRRGTALHLELERALRAQAAMGL